MNASYHVWTVGRRTGYGESPCRGAVVMGRWTQRRRAKNKGGKKGKGRDYRSGGGRDGWRIWRAQIDGRRLGRRRRKRPTAFALATQQLPLFVSFRLFSAILSRPWLDLHKSTSSLYHVSPSATAYLPSTVFPSTLAAPAMALYTPPSLPHSPSSYSMNPTLPPLPIELLHTWSSWRPPKPEVPLTPPLSSAPPRRVLQSQPQYKTVLPPITHFDHAMSRNSPGKSRRYACFRAKC